MPIMKSSTRTRPRRKKAKVGDSLNLRFFLLLGFAAFFKLSHAYAEPQFEATLTPPEKLSLGQTCQLSIEVTWKSEEADYRFSEPDLRLENLAVEEIGESNEAYPKKGEPWKKKEYRFTLKALKAGTGRILPAAIRYTDALGEKEGRFETPAFEIRIVPGHTKLYRRLSVLALFLSGSGAVVAFLWKQKTKRIPPTESQGLTLEDRHVAFLEQQAKDFEEAEKDLRDYLCEKYHLRGGGATDRELLIQLESQLASEDLKTLEKIFDRLERLNYAPSPNLSAESRRLVHEMAQFIGGKRINH